MIICNALVCTKASFVFFSSRARRGVIGVKLEPIRRDDVVPGLVFDDRLKSRIDVLAEQIGKRVGGGRAQMNITTFEGLAVMIVPLATGIDKQSKSEYDWRSYVLGRAFNEYGWTTVEKFVIIAAVQKYIQDPKDGFIPLSPGSIDIEAGMDMEAIYGHRELVIHGESAHPHLEFLQEINSRIGFATEYGNGPDSLEIIIPVYTPGKWQRIEDIEFGRETGIVIVSPYDTLWCRGLDINNLELLPLRASVKLQEAVKIARHVLLSAF